MKTSHTYLFLFCFGGVDCFCFLCRKYEHTCRISCAKIGFPVIVLKKSLDSSECRFGMLFHQSCPGTRNVWWSPCLVSKHLARVQHLQEVLDLPVPLLMLTQSTLLQCGWSGPAAQGMGLRIMLLWAGVKEPGVPGRMGLTNWVCFMYAVGTGQSWSGVR